MDIRRRMLVKKKSSSSGGGGSTTGGSYTVNLNSQWEATTEFLIQTLHYMMVFIGVQVTIMSITVSLQCILL